MLFLFLFNYVCQLNKFYMELFLKLCVLDLTFQIWMIEEHHLTHLKAAVRAGLVAHPSMKRARDQVSKSPHYVMTLIDAALPYN